MKWTNEYYDLDNCIMLVIKRIGKDEKYEVLIDKDDFENVSKAQWYVCIKRKDSHLKNIINIIYTIRVNKKKQCYQLHQWILNTKNKNVIVDHKDMNRLNNRKNNLRIVSASINRINQEYKCFTNHKNEGYSTTIRVDGKDIESQPYKTKDEAIISYLKVCLLLKREQDSVFIRNKIVEYNVKITEDDFKDPFIKRAKMIMEGKEDVVYRKTCFRNYNNKPKKNKFYNKGLLFRQTN